MYRSFLFLAECKLAKLLTHSLFLLLFCCCHTKPIPTKIYRYKHYKGNGDSLDFALEKYQTYGQLVDSIQGAACKDRIPMIRFQENEVLKEIYPIAICTPVKFDPPQGSFMLIKDGQVYENNHLVSLDSLPSLFEKNLKLAKQPERFLIFIEFDQKEEIKSLRKVLQQLTTAYDTVKHLEGLNITFIDPRLPLPPRGQ